MRRTDMPGDADTLTSATFRSAASLGIGDAHLARVLRMPADGIARLRAGRRLPPGTRAGGRALLLIRIHDALARILDDDLAAASTWLRGENRALLGRPLDRMQTEEGLLEVLAYCDANTPPAAG